MPIPNRSPEARQTELLGRIARAGFMRVDELAAAAGVSAITVRRDLAALEKDGALRRTHGGALGLGGEAADIFDAQEPSFAARRRRNGAAKAAIARAAMGLVGPGQSLAIDTGSTTYEFARACGSLSGLTIVTNSARIAGLLADSGHAVYVPAGRIRPGELSIHGAMAVEKVMTFSFDLCFIGVSGVAGDGFYDYSPEDTELKRAFMARSARAVALCDGSKFGHRALVKIADLDAFSAIVCDRPPPAELARAFAAAGLRVVA